MVVFFYVNYSRQVLQMFKSALGLWRQDQFKPVVSGIANLVMNFALIYVMGLNGAILSTIIVFLFIEIPWEGAVVFRHYLTGTDNEGRSFVKRYVRLQVAFSLFALALCAVTWWVASLPSVEGFVGLVVRGFIAATVASAAVVIVFRRYLLEFMGKMRKSR